MTYTMVTSYLLLYMELSVSVYVILRRIYFDGGPTGNIELINNHYFTSRVENFIELGTCTNIL